MIYFVLPIYNEEKNLPDLLSKLRKIMQGKSYTIVAINDGSQDSSLSILEEMKGGDLIIESSLINMNVGAVFSMGIGRVLSQADDEDIMVIMESDQTSEIDFVETLLSAIEEDNQDIAIASRYQRGGGYLNFPVMRRIFSYCANNLMKALFPISNVADYTIFFRAYRVGLLKEVVKYFGKYGLIQSKGFVANAELLIKAALFTDKIIEVPYVYDYRKKLGQSKINILRTINEYFVLTSYLKRTFQRYENWKQRRNQTRDEIVGERA